MEDNGATAHVTNKEKYMFNKVRDRNVILVGTGKETKAIVRGDVMICHSKSGKLIKLQDVLLVPNIKQNIMSIPKLLTNNFKAQASENKFEIEQQGKTTKMEKPSDGKMFSLIGKRIQKEQINAYHRRHTMDINIAHDLFNHMSEQVLCQT